MSSTFNTYLWNCNCGASIGFYFLTSTASLGIICNSHMQNNLSIIYFQQVSNLASQSPVFIPNSQFSTCRSIKVRNPSDLGAPKDTFPIIVVHQGLRFKCVPTRWQCGLGTMHSRSIWHQSMRVIIILIYPLKSPILLNHLISGTTLWGPSGSDMNHTLRRQEHLCTEPMVTQKLN